ncbi:uncharacterized protein PHA67_013569 isoform 2-T4 [Liasis olivaceus]
MGPNLMASLPASTDGRDPLRWSRPPPEPPPRRCVSSLPSMLSFPTEVVGCFLRINDPAAVNFTLPSEVAAVSADLAVASFTFGSLAAPPPTRSCSHRAGDKRRRRSRPGLQSRACEAPHLRLSRGLRRSPLPATEQPPGSPLDLPGAKCTPYGIATPGGGRTREAAVQRIATPGNLGGERNGGAIAEGRYFPLNPPARDPSRARSPGR